MYHTLKKLFVPRQFNNIVLITASFAGSYLLSKRINERKNIVPIPEQVPNENFNIRSLIYFQNIEYLEKHKSVLEHVDSKAFVELFENFGLLNADCQMYVLEKFITNIGYPSTYCFAWMLPCKAICKYGKTPVVFRMLDFFQHYYGLFPCDHHCHLTSRAHNCAFMISMYKDICTFSSPEVIEYAIDMFEKNHHNSPDFDIQCKIFLKCLIERTNNDAHSSNIVRMINICVKNQIDLSYGVAGDDTCVFGKIFLKCNKDVVKHMVNAICAYNLDLVSKQEFDFECYHVTPRLSVRDGILKYLSARGNEFDYEYLRLYKYCVERKYINE